MRTRLVAWGAALAGLLGSTPAWALKITVEPAAPIVVGQQQTFRISKVEEATGAVTFRWSFGDGSPKTADLAEPTVTHPYSAVGHYSVTVSALDDAGRASDTFVQTVHYPLTAKPPSNSTSILVDAKNHEVWNVNPDNDSVSVIDQISLKRLRELPVGDEPHALALAPDGSVWVTNQMSDEVVVLNRKSGQIEARIRLPYASQPHAIAFGPGGKAYVSLFATGQLVELDGAARTVGRALDLGPTPAAIAVAADGRVFVTRFISPTDHGEVWVVAPETLELSKTIALALDPGPDTESSGRGVPNFLASVVISPDGTQAWIGAKKDDVVRGPQRDKQPMTSDNFVRNTVCVIDLKSETERLDRRLDIDNRGMAVATAFSPIGDFAYVVTMTNNWIGILDALDSSQQGGVRDLGLAPDGLAFAPDGKMFVNAFMSREVVAFDMAPSLSAVDHSGPAALARIRTVDRETLAPDVLLGKQVFLNSADPRMSNDGYMSCASCHINGMSDGRVWDFTDRGEGLRNTKVLAGIRGAKGEGRVHWSANMDEIQDFERDIRDSFEGAGFMPEAEWQKRKANTFGPPSKGVSKELDGLAAFFESMDHVPRSPFRNADGSFTADALEGRTIFKRAGCPACHGGPDFTDSAAGALHDVGTILPSSGMRLGGKLDGIDTPTLKGLWQSAPYLHDGRAATLKEIFTTYTKDAMGKVSDLSPKEVDQLVRYLNELDDVPETEALQSQPPEPTSGAAMKCSLGTSAGAQRGDRAWYGEAALAVLGLAVSRRRRRAAHRLVP